MGTLDALKLTICGGRMPGGNWRSVDCEAAVTCALAMARLAPGCRKILMTAMPL